MHHCFMEDDLVGQRTRETSFAAQCTNHSANSMCYDSDPALLTRGGSKIFLVGGGEENRKKCLFCNFMRPA